MGWLSGKGNRQASCRLQLRKLQKLRIVDEEEDSEGEVGLLWQRLLQLQRQLLSNRLMPCWGALHGVSVAVVEVAVEVKKRNACVGPVLWSAF